VEELTLLVGEVLIVDDGMGEDQAARTARLAAETGAGLLRLPRNFGKGHAVAAARRFLLAREPGPQAVVVLDADGQHRPSALPALLDAAAQADLVVGDRTAGRHAMPLPRRITNHLSSRLLARITGAPVPDSQCGMRVLRGRALREIEFPGGRYEAETRHLKECLRAGVSVAWVPIPVVYEGETSSFRPARDGVRVLAAIFS
jgi:glycosyltransferase involved in cell wall biosynthesis